MPTTNFTGGCVLDPDTGSVARADVVVADGRIVDVGADLDVRDAEQVDCTDGLLVPGLIDCHAHVAFPRSEPLPPSARILEAVPVLRGLLARGVTTVRDAWGADVGFVHALRENWITGPDLVISLRQLSPTGGLGDSWSPNLGIHDTLTGPGLPDPLFDGPDAARAAVRRMVRAGADWIKVGASGSIHSVRNGQSVGPTDDELRAVVDEARRCGTGSGRDVMAHAHTACAVVAAATAGVRSIEHGVYLDDTAASSMRAYGCWYVPTLSPVVVDGDAATVDAHRRSLDLALAHGVPVAAGSDLAPRPHVDLLEEIGLLARAGLGDAGAFAAATTEAARLLRLDHDRGRIAAGLRADLVLLAGDDLATTNLGERIRGVWQCGRRV